MDTQTGEPQTEQLQGGCLCGAISVTLRGGFGTTMECHCADCQKAMGGGPAYIAMVNRADCTFSGELRGYDVIGDSGGTVTRFFCPNCGTPTHSELGKYPDKVVLKVGLFAPQAAAAPQKAIWTGSAPKWHTVAPGIPSFDKSPPPRG